MSASASRRARLRRIPDASEDSLLGFVKEAVATDGWPAYPGLTDLGFVHRPRIVSSRGKNASTLMPRAGTSA